jgi:hypothetical protein
MNKHGNYYYYYYYYVGDCWHKNSNWTYKIAYSYLQLHNSHPVKRKSNSYFGTEAINVFHILHVHINLQNSNMSPKYMLHTKSLSDLSMLKSVGRSDLFYFLSNSNFFLPDVIYLYTYIVTVNVPCKINLTIICRKKFGFLSSTNYFHIVYCLTGIKVSSTSKWSASGILLLYTNCVK